MLEFKRLKENVNEIRDYLEASPISFCDLSVGVKFMWRDDFLIDYAIYNGTLVMKETCDDYENAFYYPIGKDIDGALTEIEKYVAEQNIPFRFCCIDNHFVTVLSARYPFAETYNLRNWSDYVYDAQKFKEFSGKKYSGQRNHINKFKKLYPDYVFREITEDDVEKIRAFLNEYESRSVFSAWSAKEEEKRVFELVENMFSLLQVGGLIEIDGKIAAFSVGEIVGETLIVHIEKALTDYEGVYPMMANAFANKYAVGKVKYINREEDCGDQGLRISKLQYQPLEVKEKNIVVVKTAFEKIVPPVCIKTERLVINDITDSDKSEYYSLYTDESLNLYWGYDYREDLHGKIANADYFISFCNTLKAKKEEYSFALRLDGAFIGELVLHNFDFLGGAEIGFRLKREYHNKGYCTQAVSALTEYAFLSLECEVLYAKCFKQNASSKRVIEKSGFSQIGDSATHLFFALKKDAYEKSR